LQDRAAASFGDDIVVTGSRTQAPPRRAERARLRAVPTPSRGVWNACTIDDPARSLTACRAAVDPAAADRAGRADAQLADGLNRAWAGDLRGATAAFDRAVDLDRGSARAFLNRGLARARGGDERGALADLDRAVRLAPGSAQPLYQRSVVRERRGDASGARKDAERALAIDPSYRAVIR
jgi:tetratricopeptide (TPR) repeat protein